MKTLKLIPLVAAFSMLAAINAAAIGYGVNFQGRDGTSSATPTPPTTLMFFGTDTAGVVPNSFWNNVNDQYDFSPANNGTTGVLTDDTGNSSTITLTFVGDDSWYDDVDPATITTGNAKMMNGIIKHSTGGDGTLRFTFDNVPEGQYDLYVYLSMNGDNVAVNVSDSDFATTYYVREMHQFRDTNTFVPGLNTVAPPAGTRDLCNYVKLSNVGTYGRGKIGALVQWIANSDGCGVPGLELVNIGPPTANTNRVAITVQPPSGRRVYLGETNITFSVSSKGPLPGYQWYKNSAPISNATNSTYTVPAITAGDNGAIFYAIVSNNVNTVQSTNVVLTLGSLVTAPGAHEQLWYNASNTVANVESGYLDAFGPDRDYAIGIFKTPDEQGSNYADRFSGLFRAPVNGNYVFFVNSDDDSHLYISTDATPAHKYMIAQEVNWAGDEEWVANSGGTGNHEISQKRSDQWSVDTNTPPPYAAGIPLSAGNNYYIEIDHHEGGGGDFLEATYKLVGEPDPKNGDGTRISSFDGTLTAFASVLDGGYIVVTNPPQDTYGIQSETITFTITATSGYLGDTSGAAPPIAYQWQTAPPGSSTFTNIPGAHNTSFTTGLLVPADDGRKYRVTMLAADAATNSAAGTILLIRDTTPPRAIQASGLGSTLRVIRLQFNERMDKASAENPANYVINPGSIVATNASLDASGTVVTLTTGTPLPQNVTNTLTITGVKDYAGNPVAPGTTISFKVQAISYEADIIFDQPVAYYRFEDAVGSPIAHNSGNTGGDGAYYTNGPSSLNFAPAAAQGDPGPRPPAFAGFDPNNNSATFTGPASAAGFYNLGNQEWIDTKNQFLQNLSAFTLEYWVNPIGRTNFNRTGIVGQNDAVEYGFIDANTIQIWTPPNGGTALNTPYSFPDGEWHHVATIADGSTIKNYYDGVQVPPTTTSSVTSYGSSGFNVHIGGGGVFDDVANNGNYFSGHIDEVAIFTKAIPAARVAEHFSAGKNGGVLNTPGQVTPPLTIRMGTARLGNNMVIYWAPSGGTLQSKPALDGLPTGWSNVGTANPAVVPIGTGARFFRVQQTGP